MIPYNQLVPGREYIVKTFDTKEAFKGIYDDWDKIDHRELDYGIYTGKIYEYQYHDISIIRGRDFENFIVNIFFICNNKNHLFNECDYYYDVEEIKRNAKNARQQMEHRSVNMILKRVVNEEFQWA